MENDSQTYDDEQEQLRKEVDGELDLKAMLPRTPEVNPAIYRDVEPVLFTGFLTVSAEIGPTRIVFKSLNHHEYSMARLASGPGDDPATMRRFQSLFFASSVFMVNGSNVLRDRERWLPEIASLYDDLPTPSKTKIVRHLGEINRRASSAVLLTESYATETYSRYRWAQFRGLDLMSSTVTGIEGTSGLGLNWAQLAWLALNRYEDMREEMERDWENAKFIGSCFAGKGLAKVYSQDMARRRKEVEDRAARKDRLIRHVVYGEPLEAVSGGHGAEVVMAAHTVEELADQLERSLKGEQDWHDRVVEAHENRIRDQQSAQQKRLRDLAADRERAYGPRAVVGRTESAGLTSDEVQRRIAVRNAEAAARAPDPDALDLSASDFYDRWDLSSRPNQGLPSSDRDPSRVRPVPTRHGR